MRGQHAVHVQSSWWPSGFGAPFPVRVVRCVVGRSHGGTALQQTDFLRCPVRNERCILGESSPAERFSVVLTPTLNDKKFSVATAGSWYRSKQRPGRDQNILSCH